MTAPLATPPADDEQPLLDLDGLVAGIRWRRRTWMAFALVGLVLGLAASTLLPSRASAEASVYVIHENEGSGDGQSLMKTDLALLQTTTVAAVALDTLKLPTTPEKYVTTYSGTVAADNILTVTVRAPDDAQAVAGAQAVSDAFITVHVKQSTDAANANVKAYNDRQDQVQRELDDVNQQIAAAASTPAGLQTLYNRRSSLSSQIGGLQQQAQAASIGSPQVAAGTKIIDAPHRTSRSLLVSAVLYGGIGLGLGLAIGLVFAAVAAVARSRPLLRRDIAHHLGASVIAQVAAPLRGPRRFVRRSHAEKERRRVATTLARLVRDGSGPVSVLELGCAPIAAQLVKDIAEELAEERPVTVVDDLPGDEMSTAMAGAPNGAASNGVAPDGEVAESAPDNAVELVPGADFPPTTLVVPDQRARRLAIATVAPGSPWPDLRRLAAEALVVVRAGSADAVWLHTVARQLADAGILIIGVVVVHPDPRDRSDGTLWDATHMALRGRNVARAAAPPAPEPVRAALPVPPEAWATRQHLPIPAPRRPGSRPGAVPPGGIGPRGVGLPGPRPAPDVDASLPTQFLPITPATAPKAAPTNGAGSDGAATNGAATNGAATNGAATNGVKPGAAEPPEAPNGAVAAQPDPGGDNAGAVSSESTDAGDGVRGTGGPAAARKPSPRALSGRRPSPRPHGSGEASKPRPRPAGPDVQATDKFQPVVPSTPADHVEAT